MNFNEYQKQALTTALYSGDELQDLAHWVLGISGESGEIAEKVKKIIRDKNGKIGAEDREMLTKEIGDVLWYLAVLAEHAGVSLGDIARKNAEKLQSRKQRGTLHGSGDNR